MSVTTLPDKTAQFHCRPLPTPGMGRRCNLEPVPGRYGVGYVSDWSQITRFG